MPAGERNGAVRLHLSDGDEEIDPKACARIHLVGFGAARLGPSPADYRLGEAIKDGDVEGIRSAVADGADLRLLPGSRLSPLRAALSG